MRKITAALALSLSTAALLASTGVWAQSRPTPAASAITKIQRVSLSTTGVQPDDLCHSPRISGDGTKVGFMTRATNLGGTANPLGRAHVYVKILATGQLMRVDTTSGGAAGNYDVNGWTFSPDGTKVLFSSDASNLVRGDTNGWGDIFEKDLTTGAIRRLSLDRYGRQLNGGSYDPAYSPDGLKIAFSSRATNAVSGDTNGEIDVFVKTLSTGLVVRPSVAATGAQGNDSSYLPVFSPDGSRIAFLSWASNLVDGDTNYGPTSFVRSLRSNDIQMVNARSDGYQASDGGSATPVFSRGGKSVLFTSSDNALVANDPNPYADIFAKNFVTGTITLLSRTNNGASLNSPSATAAYDQSGNIFAFSTRASNIVAGDTNGVYDIYVRNAAAKRTVRASTALGGAQASGGDSLDPSVSNDGTKVAFTSSATNLVAGDTNGVSDIFVVTLR